MKPLLYDVYCGGGGATKGYQRAGFYVVGIDNRPQSHYIGDEFILMDALEFLQRYLDGEFPEAAAFHASPPCQAYSRARAVHKLDHPKLIKPTRDLLIKTGEAYVIENVKGAPLKANLMLCGTMFGLDVIRHRWFESNIFLGFSPFTCQCHRQAITGNKLNYHNTGQRNLYLAKHNISSSSAAFAEAMGIDWMNFDECQEAIPPAYTEFIGRQLMAALEAV